MCGQASNSNSIHRSQQSVTSLSSMQCDVQWNLSSGLPFSKIVFLPLIEYAAIMLQPR